MFQVIESVLSKQEVTDFLERMQTAPWMDGSKTAGSLAQSVKQNLQLDDECDIARSLSRYIESTLLANPQFVSMALPDTFYPPKFNLYQNGGHYGVHVDSAVLVHPYTNQRVRADLSATLFLTEPDSYEGGELQIDTGMGVQEIKLPAGDMILYSSGSLHQVLPVIKGQRIASFMWVQSMVKNENERTMLYQLDQSIQGLRKQLGTQSQQAELLQLTELYHNLLRHWCKS
ncbi:Fe2+-dependent dioxygenase [Thiomicrorhabdus sp. zzn3]|uniref:Fe2+-dependent dioxygenase n=1 Tax=Thiomicrorhabdus sp. zzn3 TaxID=3039775 RepID=UPI002436B2F5|nr:Fe2+-dependent dioxygenase [Thiomicrorhabdus sp. zzn3]MDG6778388.1 Fe2+-dependent dioxygenase [Thiomicrorhabdus sp. zzn3]